MLSPTEGLTVNVNGKRNDMMYVIPQNSAAELL